jgi:hypothetical protein
MMRFFERKPKSISRVYFPLVTQILVMVGMMVPQAPGLEKRLANLLPSRLLQKKLLRL